MEPTKKQYTNDVSGLKLKLGQLKTLQWLEIMEVSSPLITLEKKSTVIGTKRRSKLGRKPTALAETGDDDGEETVDVEDDFKREMHFVHQAQAALRVGLEKLVELDVPITRPSDYFAEMIKTDDHMRRVREHILSQKKRIEASEKAMKQRDLKKTGKKLQQQILEKRRQEKVSALKAVKKFGRGKRGKADGDDDRHEEESKMSHQSAGSRAIHQKSKRRLRKDEKFGYGGKRSGRRRNDALSSADMSSFKPHKHSPRLPSSASKRKNGRGRVTKRLGKAKRDKMKQRRKKK